MVNFIKRSRPTGEFLYALPPDQNGTQFDSVPGDELLGILINPTGPLGFISLLYIKTMIQMPKFGYGVYKYKDNFEINPTYREYYTATLAQKQDLETKIKAGLESAARAISDYELLAHDLRKYQSYLYQFNKLEEGREKLKEAKTEEDKKKYATQILEANTTLKAVFIDQVDVHTGEGVALKLIVSRWPNIIVDFMKLEDDMKTSEDIVKRLVPKITTAEAVVLATKNKLFDRWKETFLDAVKQRYLNLLSLMNARKKSIEQYKRWLRPYVVQHELLNETQEKAGEGGKTLTHRLKIGAHAMSTHDLGVFAWKPFSPGDVFRATVERKEIEISLKYLGKKPEEEAEDKAILAKYLGQYNIGYDKIKGGKFTITFWINPYDKVAKEALYSTNPKKDYINSKSLIEEYPWLKPKEIEGQVLKVLMDSEMQPKTYQNTLVMHPDYIYYILWDLTFNRQIISIPQGTVDDGFIFIKIAFISQNVLLTKLLERWAYEQSFDRNVEEILGLTAIEEVEKIDVGTTGNMEEYAKNRYKSVYAEKKGKEDKKPVSLMESIVHKINEMNNRLSVINMMTGPFGITFQLFKKGPYETNLKDRITRQYSKAFAETYRAEFIDWFEDAARIGD
ncbi:MAG: hypothetical protein V1836_03430 [Candidatus Aenigmatarchaeota archaeon]